MRLTLRTLLAYLDDTLEPAEIAEIGQKVAESDKAQELISRIKQVTRRRRLTTPPQTGPNALDPNEVAEYLDNVLPAEQVKELEQVAQDSDVHLAEIAASHQILTLVQGEPALVPPTAKRRFYELVTGKESDKRKAAKPTRPAEKTPVLSGDPDADESLLLGLPVYHKAPWLRWALPVAGVLVLGLMAFLLYNALPKRTSERSTDVASVTPTQPEKSTDKPADKPTDKPVSDKPPPKDKPADKLPGLDKTAALDKAPLADKPLDKDKDAATDKDKGSKPVDPVKEATTEPSRERREIAKFVSKGQILARKVDKAESWERVSPEAAVLTTDRLVSLPGYQSELRLDSGIDIKLFGCLPELIGWAPSKTEVNVPPSESAVMLHVPPPEFDADLTLDRGRIYLTNTKDKPAKVRIRFAGDEIWDITLEEQGTRVALQLVSEFHPFYSLREEDAPLIEMDLLVEKGEVAVKNRYSFQGLMTPTNRNRMLWSNKKGPGKPFTNEGEPSELGSKPINPKAEREVRAPLIELADRLAKNVGIEAALISSVQENRTLESGLSVRCLGAIEATAALYDVLNDPKVNMGLRHAAIFALRRYVNRGQEQMKMLYDPKNKAGLFVQKQLSPAEAETMLYGLRNFFVDGASKPEVFDTLIPYLKHEKLPLRELAYWHLKILVGDMSINYDAAAEKGMRDSGADSWKNLRATGKLPRKMQDK